jgi:hypothetical protein
VEEVVEGALVAAGRVDGKRREEADGRAGGSNLMSQCIGVRGTTNATTKGGRCRRRHRTGRQVDADGVLVERTDEV